MADGELTLTLDGETARKLLEAAELAGMSAQDLGAEILANSLPEPLLNRDHDPAIDSRIAGEAIARRDSMPLAEFRERMKRFGRHDG